MQQNLFEFSAKLAPPCRGIRPQEQTNDGFSQLHINRNLSSPAEATCCISCNCVVNRLAPLRVIS